MTRRIEIRHSNRNWIAWHFSATEASNGLPIWSILVFPLLFTTGMSLVDTLDGTLMLGAYDGAFIKPIRKLYYNLRFRADRPVGRQHRGPRLNGQRVEGNSPEQLFAVGYSACFIGAMKFVATQGGPRSEGGFGIEVDLEISLPGMARADAETLVAKAHQVCPYSNATRKNIPVLLSVL